MPKNDSSRFNLNQHDWPALGGSSSTPKKTQPPTTSLPSVERQNRDNSYSSFTNSKPNSRNSNNSNANAATNNKSINNLKTKPRTFIEQLQSNRFSEVTQPDTKLIREAVSSYTFSRNEKRKLNKKSEQLARPYSEISGELRNFWQSTISSLKDPQWYDSTPWLKIKGNRKEEEKRSTNSQSTGYSP